MTAITSMLARRAALNALPECGDAVRRSVWDIEARIGDVPARDAAELDLKFGVLAEPETLNCPNLAAGLIAGIRADAQRLMARMVPLAA